MRFARADPLPAEALFPPDDRDPPEPDLPPPDDLLVELLEERPLVDFFELVDLDPTLDGEVDDFRELPPDDVFFARLPDEDFLVEPPPVVFLGAAVEDFLAPPDEVDERDDRDDELFEDPEDFEPPPEDFDEVVLELPEDFLAVGISVFLPMDVVLHFAK